MTTIIDLLQADGINPVHASLDEHHSPCPECGGKDRFSCWPHAKNRNGQYMGGRFVCRQCGLHGDAVAYLMKRQGMDFRAACTAIGIDQPALDVAATIQHGWDPSPPKPEPCEKWQDKANHFLLSCIDALQRHPEIIEWLHIERGLTDETIRRFRLGWNPKDQWADRQAWGLPEAVKPDGKAKKLWFPAGLVIPYFPGGRVIRLRIRRHNPGDGSRYVVVSGSSCKAMEIGRTKQAVVIVESELDAILVAQEAGDMLDTVAMGSAQAKPDAALHDRLMNDSLVLVGLDSDTAGAAVTWTFWHRYPGFKRWPAIRGKDPCEMMRTGVPIRAWIEAGTNTTKSLIRYQDKGNK